MHQVRHFTYLALGMLFLCVGCGTSDTSTSASSDGNTPSVTDTQAPLITLNGDQKITLFVGDSYKDPGALAMDDKDGDISSRIIISSDVNYAKAGTYTITYIVSDRAGHETTAKREISIYQTTHTLTSRSGLIINEIMASNASTNLDPDYKSFSDWIELYNHSTSPINIGGYFLSDDKKEPTKWTIPNGTTLASGGYLIIWLDKKDNGLHANFSLNADGESITLYDRNRQELDSITFTKQKSDISCAKMDDTLYYMDPTPGFQNRLEAITPAKRSKKPIFSKESGFYTNTVMIELSQINDADIYYTTDGSTPTKNSTKYTSPISLNQTTVIRTRSYNGQFLPSKINTHTYLINENTKLPVVSIALDNKYLYDDKMGIYTLGTDANGNTHDSDPSKFRLANYGQDWERPASFEYIFNNKVVISENVGIKIHGRYSRALAQKSFNIYARNKYDDKYIRYPLFPNKPNITKIKSFTLRNSGGDWGHTMLRDAMTQSLIKDTMNLDYQDYQPAILFLNGRYWGIQNIRERSNSELIRTNHNIKTKNMDLLAKTVEIQEVYEGDNKDYAAMIAYIHANDLSSTQHYNYISTKMDINNYINYMVTEMFIGADDWPLNNNKYWRERVAGGKWKWILFDTDSGFWNYKVNRDPFDYLLNTASYTGGKNTAEATFLFRNLMKNSTFKTKFLKKFEEHLSTTFATTRVVALIEEHESRIEDEIERHLQRWKNSYIPSSNRVTTKAQWEQKIEDLKSFAHNRIALMRTLISQQ